MGRRREERMAKVKARLEEAAEELRGRAEAIGAPRPKRKHRGRRLLPLAALAGIAALLRGDRGGQLKERGKGLVEGGKGVAGKAAPAAGRAKGLGSTLLGKAREAASRARGG